ncbi:MAG: 50S ribosomal protein L9 [Candidatus Firestonebacteria bacterium]
MKIILIQDVEKLGKKGDVKTVSDGYARNFLLPGKLVKKATEANIKLIEEEKKKQILKSEKEKNKFVKIAEKIKKLSLVIPRNVGEENKMFGAVTAEDISEALKLEEIDVDKRKIELDEPIKFLGTYDVAIKLHPEVMAVVKVWVVKS